MDLAHDTLRFTRKVEAPVEAAWVAYASVEDRCRWSVPDGEQIVYDTANFTEGGEDSYRCGPPKTC